MKIVCGPLLEDRPLLAKEKVRYFGEPVALVIANSEFEAKKAAQSIIIDYEPIAVVNTISDAIKYSAILLHENLDQYRKAIDSVYPKPGTNIAHHTKIRKGDMLTGWSESQFIAEGHLSVLPKSYKKPLTPADVNTQTTGAQMLKDIIIDGNIIEDVLKNENLDNNWVNDQLSLQGINDVSQVFYTGVDKTNNMFISKKRN